MTIAYRTELMTDELLVDVHDTVQVHFTVYWIL